ncbi:MAG: replication initiation protein (plasmid) [Spiroplasma endosymbiont of Drosophila atripex]|nr:MAG: replication initiation protein [Spiroplasma endosymbiont of Drosophila atripex]
MNSEFKNQYDDFTIYYANELARKYCKFTLEEQKVLHLIFSQIKPYEKNPTTFKLKKLDFFNKLELESKDRYPRYRKLVQGLINKSFFEIKESNGDELVGVVIYSSKWFVKQPFFEIKLNPDFMPYLEELVKNFTKLELNSILKLKSKHSLTLYKFLCSWTDESKKINQRFLTTKELKELFGLSIDDYVYNGKFNRKLFETKTISIALKELNEKTNIIVSFQKKKKGNKVQNYEFTWIQKEKSLITKTSKKQVSLSDLKKEKQQNIISNEFKQMLNNIDKDSQVVFDN